MRQPGFQIPPTSSPSRHVEPEANLAGLNMTALVFTMRLDQESQVGIIRVTPPEGRADVGSLAVRWHVVTPFLGKPSDPQEGTQPVRKHITC